MIFRPYQCGDILDIIGDDFISRYGFDTTYEDLENHIDLSIAWTGICDEEIIGCGGFRKFWNGVYEAWIIPKNYQVFYDHRIQVMKFIKKQMKDLNAHRIQATIASSELQVKDILLVRHLGLHYESTLVRYGPKKQDYHMYAKVS